MKGIYLHPLRHKALQEGRLSVLRVPFREQPKCFYHFVHVLNSLGYPASDGFAWAGFDYRPDNPDPIYFRAPFAPGDCFVREAFRHIAHGRNYGVRVQYEYNSIACYQNVFDPCPNKDDKWRPTSWKNRSAAIMPEWASRYILTLGPPVPGKLGEVDENTIYAEGVYFPPPYIGVNYEDGSAIEHPDIAMDPWQHHERFWNTIYPRHPWSPDRWTWAYPVKWRKR
jgi:hypothetical protein